jgi:hypothetical protein
MKQRPNHYPAAISRCDAATVNILPAKFHLEWTASLFGGRFTSWAKPNGRLAPAAGLTWSKRCLPAAKGSARFCALIATDPIP